MASISANCVLMTQILAAKPLDPAGSFFAVRDKNNDPMIFSRGSEGKLYLLFRNATGNNELVDLGKRFQIDSQNKIVALNVTQDKDLTMYITFASATRTSESTLHIVKPIKPDAVDWSAESSLLSLLYTGERQPYNIQSILLGTNDDRASSYPFVAITYNKLDSTTKDLTRVSVEGSSWKFKNDLKLTTNAPNLLSVCVGNQGSWRGVWYLWKGSQGTYLDFAGLDVTEPTAPLITVRLPTPPGAQVLASYPDQDGSSELIVGGDGLYHFDSATATEGGSQWTRLDRPDDTLFKGISKLDIGQIGNSISIWGLDKLNTLAYQEITSVPSSQPIPRGEPVPLLDYTEGGGRFSALRRDTKGQAVYVIGADETLRVLTQDIETRLWQASGVQVPTIDTNYEINAYTTRAEFMGADEMPIRSAEVLLCSSSPVFAIVNGYGVHLTSQGAKVKTDASGVLTVIIEAEDAGSPVLTIKESPTNAGILGTVTCTVDPMAKLNAKIDKLATVADLRNVTLPGGEKLVDEKATDQEVEDAIKALKELRKASNGVPPPGARLAAASTTGVSKQSFGKKAKDAWRWICKKAKNVGDYVVKKVKEGWELVVTIAGQVYNFVLDGLVMIGKAISRVLEVIGASIRKLIKWIGFLFEWDDIVDTHHLLVNFFNCGILMGVDYIDVIQSRITSFIGDLKEKTASINPETSGKMIGNEKIGKNNAKAKASGARGNGEMEEVMGSPQANFGQYQSDHGGVALKNKGGTTKQTGVVQELLDTIGKVMDKMQRFISQFGTDFIRLLKDGDQGLENLLKVMGSNMLTNALEIFEEIIVGMLRVFNKVMLKLADLINEPIKVPVISCMYKKFVGGELTVLSACSIIMAIPFTLIYKLVRNEAPKDMPGVSKFLVPNKYRDLVKQRLNGISQTREVSIRSVAPTNGVAAQTDPKARKTMSASASSKQWNQPSPGKVSNGVDWWKEFKELAYMLSALMAFGKPIFAKAWWQLKTFPSWVDPSASVAPSSVVFKWLLWLVSIPFKFEKPGAGLRLAGWGIGVMNPIAGCVPEKMTQTSVEIYVAAMQFVLLIPTWTEIGIKTGAADTHWTLMIAEFMVVVGQACNGMAGQSLGQNYPACLLAAILLPNGYRMMFGHAFTLEAHQLEVGFIDAVTV